MNKDDCLLCGTKSQLGKFYLCASCGAVCAKCGSPSEDLSGICEIHRYELVLNLMIKLYGRIPTALEVNRIIQELRKGSKP